MRVKVFRFLLWQFKSGKSGTINFGGMQEIRGWCGWRRWSKGSSPSTDTPSTVSSKLIKLVLLLLLLLHLLDSFDQVPTNILHINGHLVHGPSIMLTRSLCVLSIMR